ncbi:MAG TPA: YciI family protein [Solirubrobacterales bacterium]|jgi:hypothetical protein|nr:YciI family protein [Solirubrobacterales bacterium]
MQYLLLIYSGEAPERFESLSEAERKSILAEYTAIMETDGVRGGAQLQPGTTATTVRVNGSGEALTTDGPFATTKEVLGGYFLLEADDLDTALEVAARVPAARMGGAVEVRPLVER